MQQASVHKPRLRLTSKANHDICMRQALVHNTYDSESKAKDMIYLSLKPQFIQLSRFPQQIIYNYATQS